MIPDKHDTVYWWSPFVGSEAIFLLGVELVSSPQPDPLDWHVWHCVPMPDSTLGMGWIGTGRRVRDIGGVWLGPCEPPERSKQ